MNPWLRLPLYLIVATGLLGLTAVCVPVLVPGMGSDMWQLPLWLADVDAAGRRSEELDRLNRAATRRAEAKLHIIDGVIDGRIGFEQAVALFRGLVEEDAAVAACVRQQHPSDSADGSTRLHLISRLEGAVRDDAAKSEQLLSRLPSDAVATLKTLAEARRLAAAAAAPPPPWGWWRYPGMRSGRPDRDGPSRWHGRSRD